jgi:hypothetical protein
MTTYNEPSAVAMAIEIEEANALQTAEETLREIQFTFGTNNTIQALETGEIITGEEIARARAILDFVAHYRMVKVI